MLNELATADPRVRVLRQRSESGPRRQLPGGARGRRGLSTSCGWPTTTGWIRDMSRAVSRCSPRNGGTVLVCGRASYYADGAHVVDERPINLISSRPGVRVIRYFGRVSLNGPLFGLARRDQWTAIGFPPSVAGDWILVAATGGARARPYHQRDSYPQVAHRAGFGLDSAGAQLRDVKPGGVAAPPAGGWASVA